MREREGEGEGEGEGEREMKRRRTSKNVGFDTTSGFVVQEGIAHTGGTQLGMLGGAPAAPRPSPLLPPSAIRTALSNVRRDGVI